MTKAREPDDIIDADFFEVNSTGYDGVRGVPPTGDGRTRAGGVKGAAIRGFSNAAAKHSPIPVDPRALEAAAHEMPNKALWVIGGLAALGLGLYFYNNPETFERFLPEGDDEDD